MTEKNLEKSLHDVVLKPLEEKRFRWAGTETISRISKGGKDIIELPFDHIYSIRNLDYDSLTWIVKNEIDGRILDIPLMYTDFFYEIKPNGEQKCLERKKYI